MRYFWLLCFFLKVALIMCYAASYREYTTHTKRLDWIKQINTANICVLWEGIISSISLHKVTAVRPCAVGASRDKPGPCCWTISDRSCWWMKRTRPPAANSRMNQTEQGSLLLRPHRESITIFIFIHSMVQHCQTLMEEVLKKRK